MPSKAGLAFFARGFGCALFILLEERKTEGTSKWVKWYRILAIVWCVCIVTGSIVMGWNASTHYAAYSHHASHDMLVLVLYAGTGCAIAVMELIVSMMLCEFLDNVSLISHKLSNWDYSKAAREFIEEFARNPRAGNLIANKCETAQNMNKENPVEEERTGRNTTSQNKTHAPVLPMPTRQNSDKVVCPLCKTLQRSHRRICMNCGVPFITEE